MHLSPSQFSVLIDEAVDAPRNSTEPPRVRKNRECDDDEENILGALQDAASGEDEVVEHVGGHQDSEVERWELGCR